MVNKTSRESPKAQSLHWLSYEFAIGSYLAVLVIVAVVGQALSAVPASQDGSPIESFTGGLLWMLSLVALLSALRAVPLARRAGFWLLASAALAALAVDEAVAIHERTEAVGVNDDFAKILMWLAVPFVLAYIYKLTEIASVRAAFITGYVFHALYLFVEMGDGEFFQLPFATEGLKTWEEIFELLFLACYFFGFAVQYLRSTSHDGAVQR